MDIDRGHALWTLGQFPSSEIPECSAQAMMQGFEGPAILNLASDHRPGPDDIRPSEVEAALLEMERPRMTRGLAVGVLAHEIAVRILRNQTTPEQGAAEVYDLSSRCDDEELPLEERALNRRMVQFEDDLRVTPAYEHAVIDWAWEMVIR